LAESKKSRKALIDWANEIMEKVTHE